MSLDLDMKEIHEIFFEESLEGIDVMESGLLGLSPGETNLEIINDIFRAAHSIKGGAATFGFLEISNFTHGVETLLDQMRTGERAVTEEAIEIFLKSVDCISDMLSALREERPVDTQAADAVQGRIDAMLNQQSEGSAITEEATAPEEKPDCGRVLWLISFKPDSGLLQSGNEPSRIFRELSKLGDLSVRSQLADDVGFDDVDPTHCYTAWDLELISDVGRSEIEELFEWVVDQCELTIEMRELDVADTTVTPSSNPQPVQSAAGSIVQVDLPNASDLPAAAKKPPVAAVPATKDTGSIRVSIDKIDSLLNLVGELVITQSMLARFGDDNNSSDADARNLRDGLLVLERHTRELQESAMQIRMLPIGASFSRFKRLVRDLSGQLGKKVELKLSGENTELDKTVLEKMSDPLVHLVRNSLDHGIEMPDERVAAGKTGTGTLHLSASHEGGNIVIQVSDDGAGLNRDRILAKAIERGLVSASDQLSDDQINNLIFQPGFSTADAVSDLSGRGVGMDVVRRNITDLGGRIEVKSKLGEGSTLKIRLPLTLAILDGQLVRVGKDVYIFSLLSIVETVLVSEQEIKCVAGKGRVYRLRDDYIPVVKLGDAFRLRSGFVDSGDALATSGELLVVVESDGMKMGLFVDELLDQQQVVIKSLEENYMPVNGLAGATILGDGNVAHIIDVPALVHHVDSNTSAAVGESTAA